MLGLEWKDVDFENNIISVRRTSNYTAKQGTYTDTTKTRRSQRSLKFPQEIMDMLKEYKAEQDEQALKCGDKWVETDRLFTKWNGESTRIPYEPLKNTINRRFCYIRAVLKPKNSSLSFQPIDLSSELCYNYYNKHIHSGGIP